MIYAFFAVLFTGRYPRGAFDYIVGLERWAASVHAYVSLLTDRYPPFSLGPIRSYPARYESPTPRTASTLAAARAVAPDHSRT